MKRAWVLVHVRQGQVNSLLGELEKLNDAVDRNLIVRCDEIDETPYCMIPIDADSKDQLNETIKAIKGYQGQVSGVLALRVKTHHPGKAAPRHTRRDDITKWVDDEDDNRPLNGWG